MKTKKTNKMKTIVLTLIVTLVALTSCSYYSSYPRYTNASYPKTNPDEILIYPKEIDQDYEIIGMVGADVKGDSIAAIKQIKKRASKEGADAIIHFSLNQLNSSEVTGGSGIAVKLI